MADEERPFEQHFHWTAACIALFVHTGVSVALAIIFWRGADTVQVWQPWIWIDFPSSQLILWSHPSVVSLLRDYELPDSVLIASQLAVLGGFQWFVVVGSLVGQIYHRREIAKRKAAASKKPIDPFAPDIAD
jgi:hypothetical protein